MAWVNFAYRPAFSMAWVSPQPVADAVRLAASLSHVPCRAITRPDRLSLVNPDAVLATHR